MNTMTNPYIGPRTFQKEEEHLFFGRDREARDLSDLVISENLVLFYAQSGAGKSSLINTRLIPELERQTYEVLPVARVSGERPEGFEVDNIFVYNLMRSLIRRETDPASISSLSLKQFLGRLNEDENGYFYDAELKVAIRGNTEFKPWPRALIIDQFEEIFNTHLDAWEKRQDFFVQLAQAMQDDPYLWVVLVMREDYIAALDPYAHLLRNGLRVRYYMQRLGREAAIKAVRSPAETLRPYAEGVAETLVENLASLTMQRPDGKLVVQPGQYIEPVQLQVVCFGLWENLSPEGKQITGKDLQEVGDVNQSLERYYDGRVEAVAREKNIPERLLREWFDKELITSGGTRNMVLRDANSKTGLEDGVIQTLQGGLIQAEMRAGQIWYELSHDRLIEPVRDSNAKWFEKNLNRLQRQVVLWLQQGRSDSLLLRGRELREAEEEAETLALTREEQTFLEACRDLRKREQRDRAQRRSISAALIISLILLIAVGWLGFRASTEKQNAIREASTANAAEAKAAENYEKLTIASTAEAKSVIVAATALSEAETERDKALAGGLVAQADSLKNSDHALALLLGVEAYERNPGDLTKTTLFNLLQFTAYKLVSFDATATSAAISPDGRLIAISTCRNNENGECKLGEINLFDETLNPVRVIRGEYGVVYSLTFYQYTDKLVLAAGGCIPTEGGCSESHGQITLWEITDSNAIPLKQETAHSALVKTVKFSPDGRFLASGSYDTYVLFWDLNDLKHPKSIDRWLKHVSFVNDIAFSPDGNYLAVAGDDKTIKVWNVSQKNNLSLQPTAKNDIELTTPVTAVAFSPDGTKLVSAGYDSHVRLWDWNAGSHSLHQIKQLEGHAGYITSLAFFNFINSDNEEQAMLASAGFDNQIRIWDIDKGEQVGPPLSVQTKAINQVVFGSFSNNGTEHPYLVSVSNDRTAIQWDLFTRNPLTQSLEITGNQSLNSNVGEWLKKACEATKRNLTPDEWETYLPGQDHEKRCPQYE